MKINISGLRLKWKIFFYMLGFCGLLIFILWLFQTVFLTDMYKFIRRNEVAKAIAVVEKNIDSGNLQAILQRLADESEIIVTPPNEFADPFRRAPDNRDRRMPEAITQTKEFTLRSGDKIYLTFSAMITPVNATIETLRYQLYLITGILFVLSVLLAVVIAKRVSKPIEEISRSAKTLADGKYDTHFSGKGFLEISELSSTLNTAAGELSKVEALRRELMANISHDLRTPLSLIYSYAEIMHDFPDEITPEQTQIIMDETQRLTTLVNDVLDISKLESGKQVLNLSEFNLTENVRATTERIAALVRKDGFTLSFEYDDEICVSADKVKIMQAFYNLLINAINYSGGDKRVAVRQAAADGFVRIEVSDRGEGISPENLPYIWDRYYKADKRHKRAITGTGLGLSIVKRIMDMHGGGYGAESAEGRGSTFWFSLRANGR